MMYKCKHYRGSLRSLQLGDLGTVAMSAKSKQKTLGFGMKPKPLLLKDVLQFFGNAAAITGDGLSPNA